MKKIFAIVTVLALTLSLTACGNKTDEKSTGKNQNASEIQNVQNEENALENEETLSEEENDADDESIETPDENTSNENTQNDTPANNPPANNTPSNNTPANPTPEEPAKKEETKVVLSFTNYDIDGRWIAETITVLPAEVYFENGKLVANCYVVNGYSTTATLVNIKSITISDKNGVVIASGDFGEQNFTIDQRAYIRHTFTFSGDAIKATSVDMSSLDLDATFSARH